MSLQEIGKRWSGINLNMTRFEKKDGDNVEAVPMLGIGEEDFEPLENDQLLIQGMMASRYQSLGGSNLSLTSMRSYSKNAVLPHVAVYAFR